MQSSKNSKAELNLESSNGYPAKSITSGVLPLDKFLATFFLVFSVSDLNSISAEGVQQDFTVVTYNVNNLFDGDGIALFEDYQPDKYSAQHLLKKIQNIVRVLAEIEPDQGPEIILFQEIEADQTPGIRPKDYEHLLAEYRDKNLADMLVEPVSQAVKDLPAEGLLLKALNDSGLGPYQVATGEYRPDPTGRTVAHINATFSRFPIVSSRTHQTNGARGILEVVLRVAGQPLITFNNHWKSEASNPEAEQVRIGNAKILRSRLDEIFQADPLADVIIAGDLNSHYNQAELYPAMRQTAVNGILQSQGDEMALQNDSGPQLYNLWYELPSHRRGSDVYRGQWGTLMQTIVSRGLYDNRGIQYVDNSFSVAAFQNLNAQAGTGVPIRWQWTEGTAGGFSDHLPIVARFRAVGTTARPGFKALSHPSRPDSAQNKKPLEVDYRTVASSNFIRPAEDAGSDGALKTPDNLGHIFRVKAKVTGDKPFRVTIFQDEYLVWSFDKELRIKIYKSFPVGSTTEFIGELGIHQGKWQFLIHDPSWIKL